MKKPKLSLREPFKNFLPLKQYFIQNRWPLVLGLVSLLVVDFLQLLIPLVIKKAVDLLTSQAVAADALLKQSGIILAIALMIVLFRYVWRLLIFGHSRKVEERLRNRLYEHLQDLPALQWKVMNVHKMDDRKRAESYAKLEQVLGA